MVRTLSSIIFQHTAPNYQNTSLSFSLPLNQVADSIQTLPTQTRPRHHRWAHVWDELIWWAHECAHPSETCQVLLWMSNEKNTTYRQVYSSSFCWGPFFKVKNFFSKPEPNQLMSSYHCLLVFAARQQMCLKTILFKGQEKQTNYPSCYHLGTNHLDVWLVCNVCFFVSSVKKMTSDLQNSLVSTLSLAAMSLSCMERQECTGLYMILSSVYYAKNVTDKMIYL